MFLTSLSLKDFRSYKQKKFNFSSNTTLVLGSNASGKTNLLEAIVFLSTGKSFKAGREIEMINKGSDISRVSGEIENEERLGLEIVLTNGEINGERVPRKRLLVNGISRRLFDFAGRLRTVLFEPEDIDLIIGNPSKRRDYLNFVLSQVDREYYRCLLSYEKGLRRRNKILRQIKEGGAQRSQLEFWDRLIIKNGQVLTDKREGLINFINEVFVDLQIFYDRSTISEARLEHYRKAEEAVGATLVGPHRDNFVVAATTRLPADATALQAGQQPVTSRDLAVYGSRGEQRMAILFIKLAELEFMVQKTGDRPLLLLDDIFSELDREHRSEIINIIPKQQTIITTTDAQVLDKKLRAKIEIIKI